MITNLALLSRKRQENQTADGKKKKLLRHNLSLLKCVIKDPGKKNVLLCYF